MKIGDKIQIKKYSDIHLNGGYHDYLFFASSMIPYCNKIATLGRRTKKGEATSKKVWAMSDIPWLWHEDWFIKLGFFTDTDEDFEI